MAKAYTFEDLIKRNAKIANTPLSDLYKDNGDEAQGEILDVPSLSRDQAAAQASAAAQAAAKALYTGGQYKTPNTLIPGMTYTEWLTKGGMNGQAQKKYDAAVRAAETDYAKTLALYGQNAETLGRAGLTGSGYTDYLTGAGFSAMQGAKVAAADTKALTEAQQRLSYADYLAGVDAQNAQLAAQENAKQEALAAEQEATAANIKSTIDTAIQQGMDDKAIMAMIQQHYGNDFDSYLSGWIANAHTYNDPLVAQNAQRAADAEAAKYREEIFNQLKAGVDPAIVRSNIEYVMKFTGADTSQLDTWMAEAQAAAQPTVDALNAEKTAAETEAAEAAKAEANARQQQANAAYASLIGGDTRYAPAVAERELKNAGYSDDEILAARTNFQANNFDTGVNNIEMATTADQLADYSSEALELSVQAGVLSGIQAAQLKQQARAKRAELLKKQLEDLADSDTETASADAEALFKQIDKLGNEDLSDEGRAALYALRAEAYINTAVEGNSPVTDIIQTFFNLGLGRDDANKAASDGFIDGIAKNITVLGANASSGAIAGPDAGIVVKIGQKDNGDDATEIIEVKYQNRSLTDQEQEALGVGKTGDVTAYNGTLYVRSSYGWRAVKKVTRSGGGGKNNAELLYNLLIDYYSK